MLGRAWFIAVVGLCLAFRAHGATVTVTSTADAGGTCPGANCTLRQAIIATSPGDTINFAAGITTITLTSGELLVDKNLTINGPGANLLTVVRDFFFPDFRIFRVTSGATVTISDLTIKSGRVAGSSSLTGAGGGVYNDHSNVTLNRCTLLFNAATFGGAVSSNGTSGGTATMVVNGCAFIQNRAFEVGGAIHNTGLSGSAALTVSNCTLSGNLATSSGAPNGAGGAAYNFHGSLILNNTTLSNNTADLSPGGIFNVGSGATLRIASSILHAGSGANLLNSSGTVTSLGFNLSSDNGGGFLTGTGDQINTNPQLGPLQNNGGPTETHALLSGSPAIEAGQSGGVFVDQRGLARPVDSPTIANVGDGSDIGAYEVQADQLPGCSNINRIVNNNNDAGTDSLRAVIANVCGGSTITFAPNVTGTIDLTSGELVINKGLTILGPGANLLTVQRSFAGGTPDFRIFNIPGAYNVALSGLTIANGRVSGPGGGILNNQGGALTITNSTITGNSALGFNAGGGIANGGTIPGTLTVINSTLSANSSSFGGGAISGGTTTVISSTISGNSTTGNGGGITAGTITLRNSTIAGNTATSNGGGVFNNGFNGATVTARNTIIAVNTAPNAPDAFGVLSSNGFNLVGNASGAAITPAQFSDQIGSAASPIDPLLGPLQDNSGSTFTRSLLAGSTAIDKGNAGGATTDQRGFARPVDRPDSNAPGGDGADIGAFEVQAPLPTPTPTPTPTATPTATPKTVLANISTRLKVETGDDILIGGFIITGTQDKKVIIRAIGPSLTFPGKLENPTLELRDSAGTLLKQNDDWMNSSPADLQAINDSTIPPSNDLESAIVATLPANGSSYTAIVRGVNNTTGIGVVEIYDLDSNVDSKLANISTRGLVQTGDTVLIAGTIVLGPSTQKVIIRAIGPSLSVPGKLLNPTMELRDANGTLVRANDDWRVGGQEAEIIATTIPPTEDAESAIVETLQGNGAAYTAIVRGVNDTTGIAVVEVYALD